MTQRIVESVEREPAIRLVVNGREIDAHPGESLAAALLAAGVTVFNVTPHGRARGPYCNMGTCFECQVQVAGPGDRGWRWERACMVAVEAGMQVTAGAGLTDAAAGCP